MTWKWSQEPRILKENHNYWDIIILLISTTQWARKFKKVQAKKLVKSKKSISWNCIFGSFKLFPSSKIDFWPLLNLQKMESGQKIIHEIDLFHFMSFLAWTFLNFLAHCVQIAITLLLHYIFLFFSPQMCGNQIIYLKLFW